MCSVNLLFSLTVVIFQSVSVSLQDYPDTNGNESLADDNRWVNCLSISICDSAFFRIELNYDSYK